MLSARPTLLAVGSVMACRGGGERARRTHIELRSPCRINGGL
jgi:hypothetical protein